ncbi:MAG: hypothetical protein MUF07_08145 [Steroidobacteraceae bacterium]|nr:hypothetical protein [Steroidobacteraceae bacterium]
MVGVLARRQLHLHDRADLLWLGAVDHQLQRLAHERVALGADARLEAEQALLAGDVAPLDDLADQAAPVDPRRADDPAEHAHAVAQHGQRRLHQDGREGADHDDHEGGARQQRPDAGPLEDGADDDREDREHESDEGQEVHRDCRPYRRWGARRMLRLGSRPGRASRRAVP